MIFLLLVYACILRPTYSGNGGSLSGKCRLLEVVEDFFLELKTISCDIVSVACDSVAFRGAIFDPFKSIDINALKEEGTDEVWQLLGKLPRKRNPGWLNISHLTILAAFAKVRASVS